MAVITKEQLRDIIVNGIESLYELLDDEIDLGEWIQHVSRDTRLISSKEDPEILAEDLAFKFEVQLSKFLKPVKGTEDELIPYFPEIEILGLLLLYVHAKG